jgi:hypothetical protein
VILYFHDYSCIFPFFLVLVLIWNCFFQLNFINISSPETKIDLKKNTKTPTKSLNIEFYMRLNKYVLLLLSIFIFFLKFFNQLFWFNHLFLTSYNFYILLLILFSNYIFLYLLDTLILSKDKYKSELFFTLINLSILLPFIFLCNTLYSFFFFLELNGVLIFYKFVVSKVVFNKETFKTYSANKIFPKHFINMLFFQYWTAFISSILLVYTLLNFLYKFGSSEWAIMNILFDCSVKSNLETSNLFYYFLISIFIFGFLTKLGFTPIHLYKIEIYKGLPFLTIFFYTTYYFLIFFFYFCILLIIYLNNFIIYTWSILSVILSLGCFYTFALLFDINYIKAFFAYSTIINSLGFICLTVSILN